MAIRCVLNKVEITLMPKHVLMNLIHQKTLGSIVASQKWKATKYDHLLYCITIQHQTLSRSYLFL